MRRDVREAAGGGGDGLPPGGRGAIGIGDRGKEKAPARGRRAAMDTATSSSSSLRSRDRGRSRHGNAAGRAMSLSAFKASWVGLDCEVGTRIMKRGPVMIRAPRGKKWTEIYELSLTV